jgi:hypothetical protein
MPSLLFSFVILNLVYCATSIEQVSRSSKWIDAF